MNVEEKIVKIEEEIHRLHNLYGKPLLKSGMTTEELDNCIFFHIKREGERRLFNEPNLLRILSVIESSYSEIGNKCPRGLQDLGLCKYAKTMTTYTNLLILAYQRMLLER